jgi:hypothetical protein
MFTENLAPFFDTAGFADAVTYNGLGIKGIFDNGYFEGLDVQSVKPTFTCVAADASGVQGSTLIRNGVTYKVVGNEPDGTGVTRLILERQ